jgi:hypothetical protein
VSGGLIRPPAQIERSVCACRGCTRYCYQHPGHLIPSDLFRIGDYLVAQERISETKQVFDYLRASKGAVVARDDGKRWRIGTITPRMENGRCVPNRGGAVQHPRGRPIRLRLLLEPRRARGGRRALSVESPADCRNTGLRAGPPGIDHQGR